MLWKNAFDEFTENTHDDFAHASFLRRAGRRSFKTYMCCAEKPKILM